METKVGRGKYGSTQAPFLTAKNEKDGNSFLNGDQN